ncbi:hypothetical protein BDA96_10G228400 [Sorghum bicolor]|uniref:Uncharacterized protein n=1 Tax=Sorghum bicolor TaxID=4558 RepID=A0A921Q4K8_SORBI|nr:hypothetical protein BDA96_10G228400 [Sorghum bicolor]
MAQRSLRSSFCYALRRTDRTVRQRVRPAEVPGHGERRTAKANGNTRRKSRPRGHGELAMRVLRLPEGCHGMGRGTKQICPFVFACTSFCRPRSMLFLALFQENVRLFGKVESQ